MTIKVLFDPNTGQILGGQIVGFSGVDKRIDVLATAIGAKMTGSDLEDLDLSYAPPYSSAKDPINMAGFIIENIRMGLVDQFHWHQLPQIRKAEDSVLLDVRTSYEVQQGSIAGAVHIPVDNLRQKMSSLDKSKEIFVYCQSGLRSYIACRVLSQNGYKCKHLSGGFGFYASLGDFHD